MNIQIEQTTDYVLIAKLNEPVQTLHHQLYPGDFKKFDLYSANKAFEKLLSTPATYAFLAKKNSEPVGYMLCMIKTRKENAFQYEKKVLYIDQISVKENYKKQGIGKELMAKAIEFAKELEVSEIQGDHWFKNEAESNFFKHLGFEYYNFKMKK